jgi:hypothetical protein
VRCEKNDIDSERRAVRNARFETFNRDAVSDPRNRTCDTSNM